MQYYLELNNPGSGSLAVQRYSAGATDLAIGKLIRVNYRGQERGGFFIENVDYDQVKSGEHAQEWKKVTGRGAMAVLDDGIVYPAAPGESNRTFTSMPMAEMLLTLISEAKARGCFPSLRTDFSATLDSNGDPWTDVSSLTFNLDISLLDVVGQLVDLGLEFDFKLDWVLGDYVLYAYQTPVGGDVSDSVVFRPGVNCVEVGHKQDSGELKNALRVTYNGGVTEISDATSVAAYRRREAPLQTANATSSGGAQLLANPQLAAKKDPKLSITVKLEDGTHNPRAFVDYQVGDWVGFDDPDLPGEEPTIYRVRGMMLDWGEDRKHAQVTVELNSIKLERELQNAIALKKLGNGVIGASTSSPMPEGVAAAIATHDADTGAHSARVLSGGDLTGSLGIPTVAKLRGRAIKNPLTLSDRHLLFWDEASEYFEPGYLDWAEIESKPSTFAPSAHTHTQSDITDLDYLLLADGSAGTPAVRFASDTNTGFYRESTDKLTFVANGQRSLSIDGTSGVGRFAIGDGTSVSRLQIFDDNNNAASGITLGNDSGTYVQIYKSASHVVTISGGMVVSSLVSPIIKPSADSTTAIQITKADGMTPVVVVDTLNGRVGVGGTPIAKVNIIGQENEVQLLIKGHSTQTASLQEWQNNASVIVGSMSNAGVLNLGLPADTTPKLTINGGNGGGDMLTLVRTLGAVQTFGFSLNGGGLAFHDITHNSFPFTLVASSTAGVVVIGQNAKIAGSPISGTLRGEHMASGHVTNVAASELKIIGAVGTGSGVGGDIVFQTGNAGSSGTTAHTVTTKLTIKGTTGDLVIVEGASLILGTTTGTKIGTSISQKLGFFGATPIIQPSGATQAALAAYATGAFGLDSDAHMQALFDLVVAIRTALVNTGLMKGAA